MNTDDHAKPMVRLNTEQVQGQGNWALFDTLFTEAFCDHTPQPGFGTDKPAVLALYLAMRSVFPDFASRIYWQSVQDGLVATFKTYHRTHTGTFLGVLSIEKLVTFKALDAMRVIDGRIVAHWGVANLPSVIRQIGAA